MRLLIITASLALLLGSVGWTSTCPPPMPDFSWAGPSDKAAHARLRESELEWNAAASVPNAPAALRPRDPAARLDENYLRSLLAREDISDISYDLLDVAMKKEEHLEKARALFEKAAALVKHSQAVTKGFGSAYLYLRGTLRLTVGVSRAAISQAVAKPDTNSYCFQAMESAIDALRDAASYADKVDGCAKQAESIRKLRSALFDVWERAQTAKDVGLIAVIDLPKAFDDAFAKPTGDAEPKSSAGDASAPTK